MKLSVTVYGQPIPQGSMRAFFNQNTKRMQKWDSNKSLKPWRQQMFHTIREEFPKQNAGICEPIARDIPVFVRMDFYLERPASLPKKYQHVTKKPDWDKLSRGVCDSLTGSAITDDSQIVLAVVGKHYGQPQRVEIFLATLRDEFLADPAVQKTLNLFAEVNS